MIHKKKEHSNNAKGRLNYIFNGSEHEHKVKIVRFIRGTAVSEPVPEGAMDGTTNATSGRGNASSDTGNATAGTKYDIGALEDEFESVASLHAGKGENLFAHYIISLAPGEHLSDEQWQEVMQEYMAAMGYDPAETLYCGGVHNDTSKEHLHIKACRVRMVEHGPLVADNNDYEKGFSTMRKLEKKYGLRMLESPDQNWGHDYSKSEIKSAGGREQAKARDEAAVIRARINKLWDENKPKTMFQLAQRLAKAGVEIKIRKGKDGKPEGISFKLSDSEKWISGSRVKKTRLTWRALQNKEGISYEPGRDDVALGLRAPRKVDQRPAQYIEITAYQPISKRVLQQLKDSGREEWLAQRVRTTYVVKRFNWPILTKEQKKQYALEQLVKGVIELIKMIMEFLFGTNQGQPIVIDDAMPAPTGIKTLYKPTNIDFIELSSYIDINNRSKRKIAEKMKDIIDEHKWARPEFVRTFEPREEMEESISSSPSWAG